MPPQASDNTENHWTLDKRIPAALILAIIAQTSAGVWWASSSTQRINHLEAFVTDMRMTDRRLTKLEQISVNQTATLLRIEKKLDRAVERQNEH